LSAPSSGTSTHDAYPPGADAANRVALFENGPTREWFNPVLVEVSPRGGHFTPVENPDAVVAGIRKTFRALRTSPPRVVIRPTDR
jgi:pimeloyl-ACP methyl ester carboxylesterase